MSRLSLSSAIPDRTTYAGPVVLHPSGVPSHRVADVTLTIHQGDGSPLARREVIVTQRSHAFRFGCTGFEAVELAGEALDRADREIAEGVLERWLELFNTATLPYYWARFEPERGRPDTRRLLAAARWFADRGCEVAPCGSRRPTIRSLATPCSRG